MQHYWPIHLKMSSIFEWLILNLKKSCFSGPLNAIKRTCGETERVFLCLGLKTFATPNLKRESPQLHIQTKKNNIIITICESD